MTVLRAVFDALPTKTRWNIRRRLVQTGEALRIVPHCADFISDVKNRLSLQPSLIFDIGANIGQLTFEYRRAFANARIYAFEPDPKTFEILKQNITSLHASAFPLGFGDKEAVVRFDDSSEMSSIHHVAKDQDNDCLPLVQITTLDSFCLYKSIEHIDIVKIDTEGHDLNVIRGASSLLNRGAIKVLICECGLTTTGHERLVPFADIHNHMASSGYSFFGLYHQTLDWRERKTIEYGNCAYVKLPRP